MRLAEMRDGVLRGTLGMQRLSEREVRGRSRLIERPRPAPAQDLVGRECVTALRSEAHPVSQRADIRFGVDGERLHERDALALGRGCVRRDGSIQERGTFWVRGLRWTHDRSSFVDPYAARHIDDPEERVDDMRVVDQRGMLRRGLGDPRTRGGQSRGVDRDGDDLEAERMKLGPQLLPHGQVKTTPSPRGPCDEQDLLAA